MVRLVVSILLAILIWWYIYSLNFALVIVTAIFIHESGHFYWMGKEGIKDKEMFFLPPMGAVAISKEPWPSHGAELRIALAGPAFGLLSVALFYILYLIFPKDIFMASMALACLVNLFNLLLPIAILDGGRVIKSILYSLNQFLGDAFYPVSFVVLFMAVILGSLSILLGALIAFGLYNEWQSIRFNRSVFRELKLEENLWNSGYPGLAKKNLEYIDFIRDSISTLEPIVNMKKMTKREMIVGFLFYLALITVYSATLYRLSLFINVSLAKITSHFQ